MRSLDHDVERFVASATLFLVSASQQVQMSDLHRLLYFWTGCGSHSLRDTGSQCTAYALHMSY